MCGVANRLLILIKNINDGEYLKRKTNEQFLLEMSKNHNTLEVLGKYINGRTKIKLKCKICGYEFSTTPGILYMGSGCPKCAGTKKKTTDEFIEEMAYINPRISVLGEYRGNKTKIQLKCMMCGCKWEATPNSVLRGRGCPKCGGKQKKSHEQFISEVKIKHPDIEVLGLYKNNRVKVKCRCNKCGEEFMGIPHSILDAWIGCPRCNISTGEKSIRSWLRSNGIDYIQQHTFNDCRDKHVLPFDFYLPNYNTIIEYDGKQHFEKNDYFGGESGLLSTQRHDKIKNDYCLSRNIRLIRIPYWEFKNINTILSKELAN